MKNSFKRIINSIFNHKKDSLLIFGLVFVLVSFVMIYWLFYFSCSALTSSINDKATISAVLSETELNGQSLEGLNTLFKSASLSLDNNYDSYKSYYQSVLDNVSVLKDDEAVIRSSVCIKADFKIYLDNEVDSITSVIGYDEQSFNDDGLILVSGDFIKNDNQIMFSEDYCISEENVCNFVGVGNYVNIKNSNGDVREYEVVGIFKYNDSVLRDNGIYSNQEVIMSNNEIIDLAYKDDCLGISDIVFKGRGLDYSNKLISELKRVLGVIKIGSDNMYVYPSFELEVNNKIANSLIAPVKSMKNLFQIIALIMIVIMMLLLCNFMFYIVNKRRREFAIFMALGEKRILVIRQFLLEVVIIFTVSFMLASPFAYMIGKNISGDMLKSNLATQERIANISLGEEASEISSISNEVTSDYDLSLGVVDYLIVYMSCGILIVLSSSLSINALCRIKLKELLK